MLNKINEEKRQTFFVMYLIMFSSLPHLSMSSCTMATQYYVPPLSLNNEQERKKRRREGGRNRGRKEWRERGTEGGRRKEKGRKKNIIMQVFKLLSSSACLFFLPSISYKSEYELIFCRVYLCQANIKYIVWWALLRLIRLRWQY